jgi:hypothetical protein|tara:strand:- start:647 stop:1111 length:465 start_codon:yes stop_codon:yes gene_type:complete
MTEKIGTYIDMHKAMENWLTNEKFYENSTAILKGREAFTYHAWVMSKAFSVLDRQVVGLDDDELDQEFDFMEIADALYEEVDNALIYYIAQDYVIYHSENTDAVQDQGMWDGYSNPRDALTAIAFWALYEDVADMLTAFSKLVTEIQSLNDLLS